MGLPPGYLSEEEVADQVELARQIGSAAAAPLKLLKVDPGSLRPKEQSDYILMLTPAFIWAASLRWARPKGTNRRHTEAERGDAQDGEE